MELSAVGERVFAAEALLKRRIRKVGAPHGLPAAPPAPRTPAPARWGRLCLPPPRGGLRSAAPALRAPRLRGGGGAALNPRLGGVCVC